MTRLLTRGWTLFMLAVVALGLLGLGYALWFKVITISSGVNTGRVHASIERAFTDDDDKVDSPLDSQDTEGCVDLGAVDVDGDGKTSCDPAATGPDPKRHYDKDVARCDASVDTANNNLGHIKKTNVYPSYHCTAWFEIHNDGTIPVKIASAVATWACPDGTAGSAKLVPSTPILVDLDCDGVADASIHLTGVKICPQIDPSQRVLMDIDQHIEQGAPQGATLSYSVAVQFNQWNEPGPDCVTGCAPGVLDICVDGDGIATAGPGTFTIAVGDAVLSASAGGNPAGLDLIDRGVVDGLYQAGDDLMVEDPIGTPTCATAARQGLYDNNVLFKDCVVLDPDGSLADGDFVTCDAGGGCGLWFRDDDGDGRYDEGEDLIVDVNGNGVFD